MQDRLSSVTVSWRLVRVGRLGLLEPALQGDLDLAASGGRAGIVSLFALSANRSLPAETVVVGFQG